MNLARSTWLVRMALLGGLAAYAVTPATAATALAAKGEPAGVGGGVKGGGNSGGSSSTGVGKGSGSSSGGGNGAGKSGGSLPTSGGKSGGSSGTPISGGVGKPSAPPASPPVHAPAPRPVPSSTPKTLPVSSPKSTPHVTPNLPNGPSTPNAPATPKVGSKTPPPTTFPTRDVRDAKPPTSHTFPSVDAPRDSQPQRDRLETRPSKRPAGTTMPDVTPDRSRPISERLRDSHPNSRSKTTFPPRTIDPPTAGQDRDLVVTHPDGRSPRLAQELKPLPRMPRATLPADTLAPNFGTTSTVTNVNVDIQSASHCHDNVNVSWWWNNPCNRHCTWVDSCGISYGYVFCGSSLWWYSWYPGCSPCYRPYYYYWGANCCWAPAYYPSYSTVYVVHDDYYVPPAYGEAEAAAPAPAADGAQLLADGWTAFLAGRYGDAIESFRQSVLAQPDDPFAKLALAQGFFAIGNYSDAAFLYRRAAELLTDWPLLGDDPRGRYSDPTDHFEQLLALRSFLERVPGEPAATLVLAVQSWFSGDLAVARDAFAELHALDPADPVVAPFALKLGLVSPPPPPGGH
jgi:hypothetical protein